MSRKFLRKFSSDDELLHCLHTGNVKNSVAGVLNVAGKSTCGGRWSLSFASRSPQIMHRPLLRFHSRTNCWWVLLRARYFSSSDCVISYDFIVYQRRCSQAARHERSFVKQHVLPFSSFSDNINYFFCGYLSFNRWNIQWGSCNFFWN